MGGEDRPEKMMGLMRKHSWDKMCPWGWTMVMENVGLRK